MHDRAHPESEPTEPIVEVPALNKVWWWSLDRDGNPIDVNDPSQQLPRHAGSPPLKDGSPFTPSEYDHDAPSEGQLPADHLHVENGRITGIHGEAQLDTLRLLLRLCLAHEHNIVQIVQFKQLGKQVPLSIILKGLR